VITDSRIEVELRSKPTAPRPAPAAKTSLGKRWVVNVRLLAVTAAVLAVFLPMAYFWHAFQVERNASALLLVAARHEEQQEWMQAAEGLHRYLQLRPDDVEAIVRRAEDFYQGAKAPLQKARAVQLYAAAIALAPDRDDLQRRQMSLRLETGDYRAAVEQARKLFASRRSASTTNGVCGSPIHRKRSSKPMKRQSPKTPTTANWPQDWLSFTAPTFVRPRRSASPSWRRAPTT